MATFRVTIQYTAEITTDLPEDVLNAMVQQGTDTIDLDEDTTLANYLCEHVKQEDAYSSAAWLSELTDGDDDWIE